MDVQIVGNVQDLNAGTVLAVPLFEEDKAEDLQSVGQMRVQEAVLQEHARSGRYELTLLYPENGTCGVLFVGAGKRENATPLLLKRLAATASRYLVGRDFVDISVLDRGIASPFEFALASVEGAIFGPYQPGVKKTKREGKELASVTLLSEREQAALHEGAQVGQAVGEAITVARDLVNLPPNDLTPSSFAQRAEELAKGLGLEYQVLGPDEMKQLGMGSLLGVAAGSAQPPRLFRLRYLHGNPQTRLALVGKGLTFDSGGLSLKTAEGMEWMKADMGGGAAVVGGMVAIAKLAPQNIEITGYVGATENMPGGGAMRPGDVLTAMNGETIEVLNTDAEGRLVLADVLSYAAKEGATHLVDFATLTGAAMVALGNAASLATGKPMDWVERVVQAGDTGLDRAWPMPLYPEYREAMDSTVADIKNVGGRLAGALTAAAFLSDFVGEVPWAHLDIAGTAFATEGKPYMAEGGTGAGVGLIAALARHMSGSAS